MKDFIKEYIWFWKESFNFMQGHNKLYIVWGCMFKSIPFAINMVRHNRMIGREQEYL